MWDIIGHRQIITLLENSLQQGSLAHAYLFTGPRHIGKRTLANGLAQAVNCDSAKPPCNACTSCQRIAKGKHADVQVIDLVSEEKRDIGIEQIHEMQTAAHLPPYEGKHRVFIINNVERLSQEAANSLLKTLEEPLPRVLMILLCSKESALLPTILSRCQRLELKPLSRAFLQDALVKSYGMEPDKAQLLSRLSGGCPGWAIQAMSDEKLLWARDERLGVLEDVITSGALKRLAYAGELAASFGKNRERVTEILAFWVQWWHDILLIKSGNCRLLMNIDHQDLLRRQASALNLRQIVDFIRCLQSTSRYLEQNANPRLALELLMLRMPQAGVQAS
jgi:DNA polymerase-3 subunit delta'